MTIAINTNTNYSFVRTLDSLFCTVILFLYSLLNSTLVYNKTFSGLLASRPGGKTKQKTPNLPPSCLLTKKSLRNYEFYFPSLMH